jgi:hypothetical protein
MADLQKIEKREEGLKSAVALLIGSVPLEDFRRD